jgi:DNA-3-methyladenine glycosylase
LKRFFFDMHQLPSSFYLNTNVVEVAKQLIGKVLVHAAGNQLTSGVIVETKAYRHFNDKASHASNGRKTLRNKAMYSEGGMAYVYLCYGIHHLFNVVTNVKNVPDAVLIRALEPLEGVDIQLQRRNQLKKTKALSNGPGKLSKAMGICADSNFERLTGSTLWIEDRCLVPLPEALTATSRIGIDYAGEDASLPFRFIYNRSFQDETIG